MKQFLPELVRVRFKKQILQQHFFCLLVNLSAALKSVEPIKAVGLLDTDVYGPSVPLMMGLHETPLLTKGTVI